VPERLRVTLLGMAQSCFVETAAEAGRVVEQLLASGYGANAEESSHGFVVTVEASPSVTVEETLVREAPSARRL
jgi:hypothetical protein